VKSLCLSGIVLLVSSAWQNTFAQPQTKINMLKTPSGIRFGVLGSKPSTPAPTLFILASSLEDSLGNDDYAKAGRLLLKKGFIGVAVDMPCHGHNRKKNEPEGLAGWRARLEKGEDLVGALTRKLSVLLDHLIREGYTDGKSVAVAGTSRGGFMALHFAAAEPRVRSVAAFAPVTDLAALSEFAGLENDKRIRVLDLRRHADKLAGRSVWLCIGNNDQRVGTDQAIEFTRKVVAASVAAKKPADVQLHVMPTIGHRIHASAHDEVAAWFNARNHK
jgi:dienelactone hydrolase